MFGLLPGPLAETYLRCLLATKLAVLGKRGEAEKGMQVAGGRNGASPAVQMRSRRLDVTVVSPVQGN